MRSTLQFGTTRRSLAMLLSGLVASGSLAPSFAMAQANKPAAAASSEDAKRAEARQHYASAEEKLAASDFAGAFEQYKAANDLLPAPITMFKMAHCQDRLGNAVEALEHYRAFLAANPPSSLEERVTEAKARIAELESKLPAVVTLTSEPLGATVTVDGELHEGVTPMELRLSPGRHTIRLELLDHEPVEQEIEAEPGASQPLTLTLAPIAAAEPADSMPPPPADAPKAEEGTSVVPYVLLGLAGAGAVVGGIFGVQAMQAKSDFDKGDRTPAKADSVDRNALVADMAFGAALTFGITGLVLLLTDDGTKEITAKKGSSVQISPYVGPQSAGAGAFVQF